MNQTNDNDQEFEKEFGKKLERLKAEGLNKITREKLNRKREKIKKKLEKKLERKKKRAERRERRRKLMILIGQKIGMAYREIFLSAIITFNSYFTSRQMHQLTSEIEQQKIEIIQLRQENSKSTRPWNNINWTSVATTAGPPVALKIFHSIQMSMANRKVAQAEHRADQANLQAHAQVDQANARADQANLELQKVKLYTLQRFH